LSTPFRALNCPEEILPILLNRHFFIQVNLFFGVRREIPPQMARQLCFSGYAAKTLAAKVREVLKAGS
jgi:hypothetical protein